MWEKQDKPREESRGKQDELREENGDIGNGEEARVDGTREKGLGPINALVQAGNLYEFHLYTMKILKTSEKRPIGKIKTQSYH